MRQRPAKNPKRKPRATESKESREQPTMYPMGNIFGLPWRLRFYRSATEDMACVCQSNSQCDDILLAKSREFWGPEHDGDKICGTLASMRLMAAAPKLLQALHILLAQLIDDSRHGISLSLRQQEAKATALSVIAEALYPAKELKCKKTENARAEHWLGGPPLPFEIERIR
jgi:hypothetical protein